MANSTDDLNIDEILNSIKQYMSEDPKNSHKTGNEKSSDKSSNSEQPSIEPIRLMPLEANPPTPEIMPSLPVTMPDFIQQAAKETSPVLPQQEPLQAQPIQPSESNNTSAQKVDTPDPHTETSMDVFKNFISEVKAVQKAQNSAPHCGGFDAFLEAEIKKAISSWIDQHMASIVQSVAQKAVEKELKHITERLLPRNDV